MRTLGDVFEESVEALAAGDYAKALELLIWIHDNPDPSHPSNEMFRRVYGFLAFGRVAGVYEPAKTALVRLITAKRERVAAGTADDAMQADLRALEAAWRHAEDDT